jgi:hypothetical protein
MNREAFAPTLRETDDAPRLAGTKPIRVYGLFAPPAVRIASCVPTEKESRALNNDQDARAICTRQLAQYVADIVKSLRTCTKAPEFRALQAHLTAAEDEAKKLAGLRH